MSERDNILGRIREALKTPAPVPGAHDHEQPREVSEAEAAKTISRWLPAVGATFEQQAELFRTKSADLKTDFRLVASRDEALAQLKAIAAAEGWKKIAAHRGELTAAAVTSLALPVCQTNAGYDVRELEACAAGITECDALIAQTGSVLVTTRSAGGRALSILPPHHVVLARRDQLLPDLPAAYELVKKKYADNYPSLLCLITGPSRTGDIERILVLGAHGPKKLTVVCW